MQNEYPRMIFHVPFPLNPDATSASGIRPVRMKQAFEALGYEVTEISGYHHERKAKMKAIYERIAAGEAFDFVYSEASTTPTGLGEKITRHTSLTRDIAFLRYLKTQGFPVGLFYRDVYWQFDEYVRRVKQPYAGVLRWRYRADLRAYRTAVDTLFLPSMKMGPFLPEANQLQALALPPGSEVVESKTPVTGLRLFYVGGTGNYYRMQEAVAGVEASAQATLTICTRESEWSEARPQYADVLGERTVIVHRSGPALEPHYDETHIATLFMEPIGYRDFAAPLKLYEYLGHGKPIIATEGSLAAEFIRDNDIGWTIPYGRDHLTALLDTLAAEPELLVEKSANAKQVRHEHTWLARARQVADALTTSD